MNDITVYFIRHGESERNILPNLIGQDPNEKLTANGEVQAKKLGIFFKNNNIKFDDIYASSYARAYWTAEIVRNEFAPQQIIYNVPALREYSAGDMIDKKREEVITLELQERMSSLGMAFKFPNGESLYDVEQRAATWLNDKIIFRPGKQTIAVFSHGMTIKCLIHHIMQFDQRMTWRLTLNNTSCSVFQFKQNMWWMRSINDTRHLV
jgi:alpha-ribazole phosphatase